MKFKLFTFPAGTMPIQEITRQIARGRRAGPCAWTPGLFSGHLIAKAAAGPFLGASEHVLNQRAPDIAGDLGGRIVVREATL